MHHHLAFDPSALDPLAWAGFAAIFSYSFLTSLHCVGMCGPLACSVLARQSPRWGWASFLYNSGRMISYTLAGAFFGLLAEHFSSVPLNSGATLSRVLGSLLIFTAVLQWLAPRVRRSPFSLPQRFLQKLQAVLASWPASSQSFGLGLITVLLPCMTLHPLLLAAAATRSPLHGALTLLAFALGTLPAMVSATYMPSLLPKSVNSRWLAKIGPIFLIAAGIVTVWRAQTF